VTESIVSYRLRKEKKCGGKVSGRNTNNIRENKFKLS
jgi:hypothetical protein